MVDNATLLAIDWGTSSLRGALLGADGAVLDERASSRGILTVEPGGFPAVFEAEFGDWHARAPLTLISGMAGSKQGWVEAPYCACPAGAADIAGTLAWIAPGRIAIVPGLTCEHDGAPDVMRGEEVQIFGTLDLLGLADGRFVLPGTHSKWADVQDGRVRGFATAMTGEFYALLRKHSILARTLPADEAAFDAAAFDDAVRGALAARGLLGSAFTVRTLALFERLGAAALESRLSGLVIGEELRAQGDLRGQDVIVIGSAGLTARYERALAIAGARARPMHAQATWRGLWNVARSLPAR